MASRAANRKLYCIISSSYNTTQLAYHAKLTLMAELPTPSPAPPNPAQPAAPTPNPVMDVVAPPVAPAPPQDSPPTPPKAETKPVAATKTNKPKPPAKQGVTAAIVATVIIVLGLAALAVVAYIKQK